jgi:hypothetical protein
MEENGTGVEYPTIELGGKVYTVKFSRKMLYRMGKQNVSFSPTFSSGSVSMPFAQVVDVLHLATEFPGTQDDLAELVFDKRNEAVTALMGAWGKAFPPAQTIPLREPAGQGLPKQ